MVDPTDPEAWNAYLAEGNARQARKRVAADVLFRDPEGRILLVDPTYKPDWDVPGGMAEANEPPLATARREIKEELDLDIEPGALLCVDWVAPHGPWDDTLVFVFDGGELTPAQQKSLRLADAELAAYRWCRPDEAAELLRPYVWHRVQAALTALQERAGRYLEDGQ